MASTPPPHAPPIDDEEPEPGPPVAVVDDEPEPGPPASTDPVRLAYTAAEQVLGSLLAAGALGRIARDVTLLAQTEVGELHEGHGGGSSAMPHKQNPVAAVAALACARRTPGLVATMGRA